MMLLKEKLNLLMILLTHYVLVSIFGMLFKLSNRSYRTTIKTQT